MPFQSKPETVRKYRTSVITGKRLPSKNQIKSKIKMYEGQIALLQKQMDEHLEGYRL